MNLSNLDLKIELSQSQVSRVNGWLKEFYSKCNSRMSGPVLEDGFLKISSADIYNFLLAINVTPESVFDWFRLKFIATEKLNSRRKMTSDDLKTKYYLDCEKSLRELRYL